MFYQTLSNGEVVLYCPDGSAKPIVLSKLALGVFRNIEKGQNLSDMEKEREINTILQYFESERIIQSKEEKRAQSSDRRNKKTPSISFWIHTRDKCNLACDYCYVHKGKRKMSKDMFIDFLDFLEKLCKQEGIKKVTLKFAGGEPLIDINFISEAMQLARKKLDPQEIEIVPIIITNGTLITKEKVHILKNLGFHISVSLDGLGKYNSARHYPNGKSSFEEVVLGIDTLLQEGLRPGIISVISNQNIPGISEMFDFVFDKNLSLNLSLCREYDLEKGLILDLNRVRHEFLPQLKNLISLPNGKIPRVSLGSISFRGKRSSVCGAGHNYFSLGPLGSLGSCQMTVDDPVVDSFKNVNQLSDIQSKCAEPVRPTYCKDCLWRYACAGGCKILLRRTNESLRKPVFCKLMNDLLPILLTLEGRYIQQKGDNNVHTRRIRSQ